MDAWFLAYLIGLFGLPAQPPLFEPLDLLVLPDRAVSSEAPSERSFVTGAPVIEGRLAPAQRARDEMAERPVLPDPATDERGVPDQGAGATLSKAAITDVVRRKSESIRHCYELGLAEDEHFAGSVEVGWRIQVDGRISTVNLVGATKNKAVEECLLAEIKRWEFPPSAEPIVVGVYPFVFHPSLLTRHAAPSKPANTSP